LASIAATVFVLLGAGAVPASAAPASPAGIAGPNVMVSEAQMRRRSSRRSARTRRPAMRAPTDGNTRMPSRMENTNVPASQRGSGAETGGPARELIPRR
jgi:hypothetical protein